MSTNRVIGLVCTSLVFVLTLAFTWQGSTDNLAPHLMVAGGLGVATLLYFSLAGYMVKLQYSINSKQLHASEKVLRSTRLHKIVLSLSLFLWGVTILGIWLSVWLYLNYPVFVFQTPAIEGTPGFDHAAAAITLPIWWLGLGIAVPSCYFALYVWQEWKHSYEAITGQRLIDYREIAPYIPWMGRRVSQTPFEQIVDIDDSTGSLGNMLGWGTVVITIRLQLSSDVQRTLVLRFIPDHEGFAQTLRVAVAEWKSSDQSRKDEHITAYTSSATMQKSSEIRVEPFDTTQEFSQVPPPPPDQ